MNTRRGEVGQRRTLTALVPAWLTPRLLFVVAAVALVRAAMAFVVGADPERLLEPDSPTYLQPAAALLREAAFNSAPGSNVAEFVRTPGYPAFLAVLMWFGGESVRVLAVLQAALSALVIVPVFALARQLFNRTIAWFAAALFALDPLTNYYSFLILTETLTTAVLVASVLALNRASNQQRPKWRWWAVAGVIAAIAPHVRPSMYFFPVVLLGILAALWRRRRWSLRQGGMAVGALLLPVLLIVGGWQVRNQNRVESSRFSGIDAMSIYLYRGAGVIAQREGRDWIEVQSELSESFGPRSPDEAQGTYYDRMYERGWEIVSGDVPSAAIIAVRGLWRSAVEFPMRMDALIERWNLPNSPVIVWILRLAMVPVWIVVAVGAWRGWARPSSRRGTVIAVLTMSYVLAISSGPESYSRFRVPVMPFIWIFAAAGMVSLFGWFRSRSQDPMRAPHTQDDDR